MKKDIDFDKIAKESLEEAKSIIKPGNSTSELVEIIMTIASRVTISTLKKYHQEPFED